MPRAPLPDHFSRHFPTSGLWRIKRGRLSATIAAGNRIVLPPPAMGCQVCPPQKPENLPAPTIGAGKFRGDSMEAIPGGVRLVARGACGGEDKPRYALPLNKPVPFGEFYKMYPTRETWNLPGLTQALDIVEVPGGFDLHLWSEGSLDRIAMELEYSFEGPGEWETVDSIVRAADGQEVFLKSGYGIFRRGNEGISANLAAWSTAT